jgi:nitroreductase / dihydropteridine reductase
MDLLKNLKWRYSVKKYSNEKVEQEKVDKILEAINLSASSTGLQPYRVIVVENKELQKSLREGSFNGQIEEASHLLVFASLKKITEKHVDDYLNFVAEERSMPVTALHDYRKALESWLIEKSEQENSIWAARQAYIGLGTALIAAAELKVDSTPMEGFDPVKFDEILNLKDKGLTSVVIMSLGYRDSGNDWLENLKKVRLPINDFVQNYLK